MHEGIESQKILLFAFVPACPALFFRGIVVSMNYV
jgi:hypothetical protein